MTCKHCGKDIHEEEPGGPWAHDTEVGEDETHEAEPVTDESWHDADCIDPDCFGDCHLWK